MPDRIEGPSDAGSDVLGELSVGVRHDDRAGAGAGCVEVGKPVAERGGEYSRLVFRGNEHLIDEAAHRLAYRGDEAHDATVEPCHRGLRDPRDCVGEDLGELHRARLDVDVRVLPDDDHRIHHIDQLGRKVTVEVEEHTDASLSPTVSRTSCTMSVSQSGTPSQTIAP